jgi:hypothetical protein
VRGQRRRRILLSFEGLLSRDRRLPSRSSHRSRERARARGMPSQSLPSGRRADLLLREGAGSTRLMRHGVQCSRGIRDDRSERAPLLHRSNPLPEWRADLSSRQLEGRSAATAARLHRRRASDPVRGKARGASQSPLSDRALNRVLLGGIDPRTSARRSRGSRRACGNALGLTRGSSRSPAVVVRSRSPRCATPPEGGSSQGARIAGVLTSPS